MRLPWVFRAASLTLLAIASGLDHPEAVEQFAAYRQSRPDGAYVDWYDGHVGILGRATSYQDLKLKPYFLEAQQAAMTDARAKLLDYLRSMTVDGARRIGADTALVARLRALLEQAPPGKSDLVLPFKITVLLKVPLHGAKGILSAVLQEPGEPADPPAAGGEDEPAPEAAGSEGPTGLVVDASGVPALATALLPKIVDETGRVVHGLETVDLQQAILRGVAAYALRVETQQSRPALATRQGERPLRVAAIGAAGPGNAWAVVTVADADRILKEASASPFLKNCNVLILAPPGGPRVAPPVAVPSPPKAVSKPAPRKDP